MLCCAVSGLWYILLMTVGVCLVLTLQYNIRKDPSKMAQVRRLSGIGGSFVRQTFRRLSSAGHGPGHAQPEGVDGGGGTAVQPFNLPLDKLQDHQQGQQVKGSMNGAAGSPRGAQHVTPRTAAHEADTQKIEPFFSPRVLATAYQNGGAAKASQNGGGGGPGSTAGGGQISGGGGGINGGGHGSGPVGLSGAGGSLGSKLSAAGSNGNAGSTAGGLSGSWQKLLSGAEGSSSSGSAGRLGPQQQGPRGPSALQVFLGTDTVDR
jgi:hypothetical protein